MNPGSAIQDHFDADAKGTLTFAEGETEKKFEVQIKTVDVDNLSFTVELNNILQMGQLPASTHLQE